MPAGQSGPSLFPSAAKPLPPAAAVPGDSPGTPPVPASPGPGASYPGRPDAPSPATAEQVAEAIAWLRWGRSRGLSSEALLFAALAGIPPRGNDHHGLSHPHCRADLHRCLQLTVLLPWTRSGLAVLAGVSRPWAALRQDWDRLHDTLAREVGPSWPMIDRGPSGFWPDTPDTTDLLRRTLARAGATT